MRPIRQAATLLAAAVLLVAAVSAVSAARAHDLFLRVERYRVPVGARATVRLMNGAFKVNEAPVEGSRVRDLSVVSPAGRARRDTSGWGYLPDSTTTFPVETGRSGTYVVGVSLGTRDLTMKTPQDFTKYLTDEGLDAIVAARAKAKLTATPARERYEKHVKLLLQVGDSVGGAIGTPLDYPAELVPLDNPYAPGLRGAIRVRALVDGKPAPGEAVFIGGLTMGGDRIPVRRVRTDSDGEATLPLSGRGPRWIKFIHMEVVPGEGADYHSKWATLTFGWR